MAISKRITEESVFVVDGEGMEKPSTKLASSILNEFEIDKSFTFVYSENDDILIKSFRNIKNSNIVSFIKLSTFDVISKDYIIFSKNAISDMSKGAK
tara:strand:- start:311 stop:601 length:291 start_codon:yes stop_codon:yes gene_type:complete